MNQEDELLQDEIGSEYASYKKSTAKWIPNFKRYNQSRGVWSWQGIRASKEWKTVIWIMILFVVLYLREEFYQEKEFFNEAYEIPKHLFFICMMLLLAGADAALAVRKKFKTKLAS